MHAASVHPEPGSNSRKIYIISQIPLSYNLSSYFILASFTLLSIYNSFDEICTCFFALYLSLVVQFSMTVRCLFRDSFISIPQHLRIVNTFFEVFSFFSNFFFFFSCPSFEHLLILPLSPRFVKHFFHLFCIFCIFAYFDGF